MEKVVNYYFLKMRKIIEFSSNSDKNNDIYDFWSIFNSRFKYIVNDFKIN